MLQNKGQAPPFEAQYKHGEAGVGKVLHHLLLMFKHNFRCQESFSTPVIKPQGANQVLVALTTISFEYFKFESFYRRKKT